MNSFYLHLSLLVIFFSQILYDMGKIRRDEICQEEPEYKVRNA